MNDQQSAEDRALDEALAQARAAFAGMSDEELLEEIADVVNAARAARRLETPVTGRSFHSTSIS
jgi:hypothetical protein